MHEIDKTPRLPSRTLRVVICDPSPLAILNDPCTHRSVEIELTEKQRKRLELRWTGKSCGRDIYERVSSVFFEE